MIVMIFLRVEQWIRRRRHWFLERFKSLENDRLKGRQKRRRSFTTKDQTQVGTEGTQEIVEMEGTVETTKNGNGNTGVSENGNGNGFVNSEREKEKGLLDKGRERNESSKNGNEIGRLVKENAIRKENDVRGLTLVLMNLMNEGGDNAQENERESKKKMSSIVTRNWKRSGVLNHHDHQLENL